MFVDRTDAGIRLATALRDLHGPDVVVVGLPRGGVPVAWEVARALGAPLDVIVVRKLGVPFQRELAMGAIGEGDVQVLDPSVIDAAAVTPAELAATVSVESTELNRRVHRFRSTSPALSFTGKTVIVVDDGVATGSTAKAACQVVKARGAARIVLAVPVAPPDAVTDLSRIADDVVCLSSPAQFNAVGQWYRHFPQITDTEVTELLQRVNPDRVPVPVTPAGNPPHAVDEDVVIQTEDARLPGHLALPAESAAIVVFVHGSGSSRFSPRNRFVARTLNDAGIGTLLLDLLTPHEETDRRCVFDIALLARRLVDVTEWLRRRPEAAAAQIGYFGASTGGGAALWAAADPAAGPFAVVSRGGRPDLAADRLDQVTCPTLLIVGGRDEAVIALNRHALTRLRCERELTIVEGATHLFEEPGALDEVASLACDWFTTHLAGSPSSA
ncbi:phosphoribosyltransferase family protein [Rhodococcus zopfii]|uniref:phosphoribosyltransferase family protein n=1 Tax=Rhodococcus zopfii TaxID=43772 RepID=UPI000ACAF6DA|nr:phosphoribosyltransferase family protein [Rhodococcus zopfii]